MPPDLLIVSATALLAAFVTGGVGYGFSSILVPVALQVRPSRILNPTLVLAEVALNAYATWVNRRSLRFAWQTLRWMLLGVVPGVAVGGLVLDELSSDTLRLGTYATLLPLIVLQLGGALRPLPRRRSVDVLFGGGVGALYAATTISGPPLALLFNNQGLVKSDFRAAMALFRLTESLLTVSAYVALGLVGRSAGALLPWLVPGILVGVPLGRVAARRLTPERFRRMCLLCDLVLVLVGLSRLL